MAIAGGCIQYCIDCCASLSAHTQPQGDQPLTFYFCHSETREKFRHVEFYVLAPKNLFGSFLVLVKSTIPLPGYQNTIWEFKRHY